MESYKNKYILGFPIAAILLISMNHIIFQLFGFSIALFSLCVLECSYWTNKIRKLLPLVSVFTWLLVFLGVLTLFLNYITFSPERFTYFFDCLGINLHNKSKDYLINFIESVGFVYFASIFFLLFLIACIWSCIDCKKNKAKQSYSLPILRVGLYVYAGAFLFLDVLQKMKIHIQWLVGIPEGLLVSLFSMYIAFDTAIYMYYKNKSESNSQSTAP